MLSRDQVIVMPGIRRLRRAKRALKHTTAMEMALVLPLHVTSFAVVAGLEMVLGWAQDYAKDLTLIGGSATLRAEAISRGLRVATDVAAWECWLVDYLSRATPQASGAAARQMWRVIRPSAHVESDTVPDFVVALGMTAGLTTLDHHARPPDECYEDAVIATLWDTSDFTAPLPHISIG